MMNIVPSPKIRSFSKNRGIKNSIHQYQLNRPSLSKSKKNFHRTIIDQNFVKRQKNNSNLKTHISTKMNKSSTTLKH